MTQVKKYFRWLILGLTFFFIISTFKQNWREVVGIKFTNFSYIMISIGLLFNIIAHSFSAWVWTWILDIFQTKLQGLLAIKVYLITNICKYLPGNIWHFYGRVKAIQNLGDSFSTAVISAIIEPLLMAFSALLITLIGGSLNILDSQFSWLFILIIIANIGVLITLQPSIFNKLLMKLAKNKGNIQAVKITKYPLLPLIGEIIFVLLRGMAFLAIIIAFTPINFDIIPKILTGFSLGWLLGLIVPGAPGGIGIFEATIISYFDKAIFAPEIILIVISLYRITSILAELITAGFAFIYDVKSS